MIKDPSMMSNLYFMIQLSSNNIRSWESQISEFRNLNELNFESIRSESIQSDESISINGIGFSNLNIDSSHSYSLGSDR